jgi:hypothetical protein
MIFARSGDEVGGVIEVRPRDAMPAAAPARASLGRIH